MTLEKLDMECYMELLKTRVIKVIEIGGDSGYYDFECSCEDYLDFKKCIHSFILRENSRRLEEIPCYEDFEERKKNKEKALKKRDKKNKDKKKKKKKKH